MVNEIRVTINMPHPDPSIIADTTRDENNNIINLLIIAAQSKYNETVIICVAGSIGSGSNDTIPVKLLIQGELLLHVPSQKFLVENIIFGRLAVCQSVSSVRMSYYHHHNYVKCKW